MWLRGAIVSSLALLWLLLMAACTVAEPTAQPTPFPTAPVDAVTAPPALTEPAPTLTMEPTSVLALPETATPVIAVAQPSPAQTQSSAPVFPTVVETAVPPTPTFAAYGITQTIGYSSLGYPIVSHRFGYGADTIVFVGGIHGGYEWNTILLAYEAIDYLQAHPEVVPPNVTVYIIPSANPDGQRIVTGTVARFTTEDVRQPIEPGRFNGNDVDLNRNWDCNWSPTALWGSREVSGGERPFSEPETQTLRQFLLTQHAQAVIFWHSKANGVYAAGCGETYQPAYDLAMLYGEAAGYPVYEAFTAYAVSGDASDWLAVQGIPAITVELKTRSELDLQQNLNGLLAVLSASDLSP